MIQLSKKEKLRRWLMRRKHVKTSQVLAWGVDNYSDRADRDKRDLQEEGFLRRLSESEKKRLGYKTREGVYEVLSNTV